MDKKEYEEIEKNANILQHNASINCNADIQKAQNYYNGYQQGTPVQTESGAGGRGFIKVHKTAPVLRFGGDYAYRRLQRKGRARRDNVCCRYV